MSEHTPNLVVMHGDQTGEELLAEALRILNPTVIRRGNEIRSLVNFESLKSA